MSEEQEFHVTATTTITATFSVWAESEEDAKDLVEDALVTGRYAVAYGVDVPDAYEVKDEGWDVHTVTEGPMA